MLRLVSWNIHKGKSIINKAADHNKSSEALRLIHCDLLCLQEVQMVDYLEPVTHRFANSGAVIYRPNVIQKSKNHGNAIVNCSKKDIEVKFLNNWDVSAHSFESRSYLHTQCHYKKQEFHLFSTHLALTPRAQLKQIELLSEIIQELPASMPIIIAGDFNCPTNMVTHKMLQMGFESTPCCQLRTFPAPLPLMRLDKIYIRNLKAKSGGALDRKEWSHFSDHLPVWIDIDFTGL